MAPTSVFSPSHVCRVAKVPLLKQIHACKAKAEEEAAAKAKAEAAAAAKAKAEQKGRATVAAKPKGKATATSSKKATASSGGMPAKKPAGKAKHMSKDAKPPEPAAPADCSFIEADLGGWLNLQRG